MWAKLKCVYEQKSLKFFTFEKKPTESISTYIAKLQELAQQLHDLGEEVSEKMLITKILLALPPEMSYFQSAWDSTAEDKKTLNQLCTRLMMEENRPKFSEQTPNQLGDGALLAKQARYDDKNAKAEQSRRPQRKCYRCGSTAHLRKACRANLGAKERNNNA